MKRHFPSGRLASVAAVLCCGFLLFLIFNQSEKMEALGGRVPPGRNDGVATKPVSTEQMPDGTLRPLTLHIPAVGRVTGARWIPGHQFQAMTPERDSRRQSANQPLDVLVTEDGRFVAARRGGARFDTRMSNTSMLRLMQYAIFQEYRNRRERQGGPELVDVSRISLSNMAWDNPEMADAIKQLMGKDYVLRGGRNYALEETLSRFEDTYYFFEVQFAGETNPRHIAVRRFTEGKVWKNPSDGPMTFPALPEPYISGTNIHGASVFYIVREHHLTEWREPSWLFLTEPWDGPCPWPEDRLDPIVGRDRLNEFFFPDEAPLVQMPDILNFSFPTSPGEAHKPFVERAAANKAARLAQEAGGRDGK